MATRIIALVFLGLFLAFVGVMASVTLFVKDPLPILGPNQNLVLETTEIQPPVRVAIEVDGDFKALVTVTPLDRVNSVRLRPAAQGDVPLLQTGDRAEAQFTRTGQWEIVLEAGGTREVIAFILRD